MSAKPQILIYQRRKPGTLTRYITVLNRETAETGEAYGVHKRGKMVATSNDPKYVSWYFIGLAQEEQKAKGRAA